MIQDQLNENIKSLISWREQILHEQEILKKRYQEIGEELEKKDTQLRNITSLLESAGFLERKQLSNEIDVTASLADCAYAILQKFGQPLYYKDLAEKLLQNGVSISGKNAPANLLAHVGRDARFKRIRSGTYALSEWKIPKYGNKRRKRRNNKGRKRSKSAVKGK